MSKVQPSEVSTSTTTEAEASAMLNNVSCLTSYVSSLLMEALLNSEQNSWWYLSCGLQKVYQRPTTLQASNTHALLTIAISGFLVHARVLRVSELRDDVGVERCCRRELAGNQEVRAGDQVALSERERTTFHTWECNLEHKINTGTLCQLPPSF
jgi:hypothetical protein